MLHEKVKESLLPPLQREPVDKGCKFPMKWNIMQLLILGQLPSQYMILPWLHTVIQTFCMEFIQMQHNGDQIQDSCRIRIRWWELIVRRNGIEQCHELLKERSLNFRFVQNHGLHHHLRRLRICRSHPLLFWDQGHPLHG